MSDHKIKTEVVVLGSGPGGYTAAFRAADLGKKVVLVERYSNLGGVCLNVGCIPSKALLHVAKVIDEVDELSSHGISFSKKSVDSTKVVAWKNGIVKKLTGGLKMLSKQRKVEVVHGIGKFVNANQLQVVGEKGSVDIEFEQAIIAAGSESVKLPFIPDDSRIFSSTGALELAKIDGDLLIIGGGIIGLEIATVYSALGTNISVVEMMDQLMPGADPELVKPLHKRIQKRYKNIMLNTKVTQVDAKKDGLYVSFEGKNAPEKPVKFDQILLSVGRVSNGPQIGADQVGIELDSHGYIRVDQQMRTNVSHIFAIGDIVGQPMLAHKAIAEARVAAEVIAGKKHYFDPKGIPSVAYTDPEVAWVGVSESEAKEQGINYGKGVFPWAASGRSLSLGRDEGLTKVIFDQESHRIIGAGIVGPHAGDLIAEAGLAIEMGCDAEDIALTIHPHPTLSETFAAATEAFEGTITDLYMPKKPKSKNKT